MDCSPPGCSVHGIFQARILEWVAISFCRGSSQTGDGTRISRTAGRLFTVWATKETPTSQAGEKSRSLYRVRNKPLRKTSISLPMLRRRYSFFRQSEVARFPMAARYQEGTHPLAPVVARRQATHFLQSACISLSPITEARRAAVWGERSCCYLAAISLKGLCGYFQSRGSHESCVGGEYPAAFPHYRSSSRDGKEKENDQSCAWERGRLAGPGGCFARFPFIRVRRRGPGGRPLSPRPGCLRRALLPKPCLSLPRSASASFLFVWIRAWGVLAAWGPGLG